MSKPTQTRRCPTCGEEFVSDEQWDEIDDCPNCVAEDPNEGIEGPWAEGGACGDQYDYQRGAIGGWRS